MFTRCRVTFVLTQKAIRYHEGVNSNSPGRHKSFTHIVPARLAERVGALDSSPLSQKFTTVSVSPGLAPTYLLPQRSEYYVAPKYGTKSIRYVTLHSVDRSCF